MKLNTSKLAMAVAICGLAVSAWAADPPGTPPADGAPDKPMRRHEPPMSVERLAMHNLIVKQLSQRTGRSETEIADLLKSQPPHEVAKTLGLDRDAMKSVFQSARMTLIDEAAQAQMITTEQADALKKAPPPQHDRHRRRGDDRSGPGGPDGDRPMPPPDAED